MILSFKSVSKSYGTNLALNGFTAELGPGIHALLGPNGSGKTTLMNIITDNLKADGGEITFDGEDVKKMGVRFRMTNLNRNEATGKVLLRVLSEEKPSPEALSVPPTLEDYYLKVFGEETAL